MDEHYVQLLLHSLLKPHGPSIIHAALLTTVREELITVRGKLLTVVGNI